MSKVLAHYFAAPSSHRLRGSVADKSRSTRFRSYDVTSGEHNDIGLSLKGYARPCAGLTLFLLGRKQLVVVPLSVAEQIISVLFLSDSVGQCHLKHRPTRTWAMNPTRDRRVVPEHSTKKIDRVGYSTTTSDKSKPGNGTS